MPDLSPPIADQAPDAQELTDYDLEHLVVYLRLLDAERDGAPWAEVASLVLGLDPTGTPEQANQCWRSHLSRAQWMTRTGYRSLLRQPGD